MPLINSSFTSIIRNPGGANLAEYLSRRFTYHGPGEWDRLLALGRFELEGAPARGDERLREGMRLRFDVVDYEEPEVPLDFRVLERGPELAFVHKPAGMPVHRTGKIFFQTLANLVREELGDDAWAPLNRLDRETSGLMAFARGAEAARTHAPSAPGARWLKLYVAVTRGLPPSLSGAIDAPLGESRDGEGPVSPIRSQMHVQAGGRPSLTLYRVIAERDGMGLVALAPITGRKHQLRAHLAHLGCPIVGDKIYADGGRAYMKRLDAELDEADYAALGARRHLLHAFCLRIATDGKPAMEAWDWDVGAEFAAKFKALEARAWCATPACSELMAEAETARA
ncbi:MAG: RluA family pseudouridine synthase [Fibrobacteres bacterium]|jgi:23S rRNA pseudouridine1911/1915/1917 synthase|nr:RluA family pseudouridine synthase [Fibrobacterota bacterium]